MESLGVLLLAAGGVLLGAWFSRLPKPYWMAGYFIPLLLVVLYAVATRNPILTFIPPISWMMMGRNKFAIIGFVGAMILTTPLLKLPKRRDRIAVSLLMACVVSMTSVWPFLAPAFNRSYLSGLQTRMGADGVCLQNTDYTCGPASAVTALRKLGFKADEGEIAILAHTSSATGTPPDILAQALQKRYTKEGLVCEFRAFKNVAELKNSGLTLAIIKFGFMVDHYVTVLDVNDQEITVGDPLNGLTKLSPSDFKDQWRFVGVVLSRK
ncbi:MAG: Peptidase bacteriocin processing [Pedosphaera sp.]|nr:Peptidase bacteriocin processing [Pedosphaera sp.]